MSDLFLNRQQLSQFLGNDLAKVRAFERLFDLAGDIPALQDGNAANTLSIDTLSDLVRPITFDPIIPISAQISSNTIIDLSALSKSMKTIFIDSSLLTASAGGPFTLTLNAGGPKVVVIPIAASGDTINSDSLMFDILIDNSGNVLSKAWQINGSNSAGKYTMWYDGAMTCSGRITFTNPVIAAGGSVAMGPFTFPMPFVGSKPATLPMHEAAAGAFTIIATVTPTTTGLSFQLVNVGGAPSTSVSDILDYTAFGQWR